MPFNFPYCFLRRNNKKGHVNSTQAQMIILSLNIRYLLQLDSKMIQERNDWKGGGIMTFNTNFVPQQKHTANKQCIPPSILSPHHLSTLLRFCIGNKNCKQNLETDTSWNHFQRMPCKLLLITYLGDKVV